MSVIERFNPAPAQTRRQRWSHYFVVSFAIVAVLIGIGQRDNKLLATTPYVNIIAGISARYPQNWLLDTPTNGEYVFRVQDMANLGFKTLIQVQVRSVGELTTPRNLLDEIAFRRAQTVTGYRSLTVADFNLPNEETPGRALRYVYVAAEANPFLESLPVVVAGIDVLFIQRGQAIIITFQSDARDYANNYSVFEQFLNSLEF